MNILILAYDWRELSVNNPNEELRRLHRDGLDPDTNRIHLLQISKKSGTYRISQQVTSQLVRFPLMHLKPFSDIVLGLTAMRLIKRNNKKFDIVVTSDPSLLWWIIFSKKTFRVCIYLNTLHRHLAWHTKRFFRYAYVILTERIIKGKIDIAMVISKDGELYAEKNFKIQRNKIHYFTPQTFSHDIDKSMKVAQNLRTELNIPTDAPVILSVSRLEAEKGIEELITAFSKINSNAYLVVVGDGKERDRIESLIQRIGIKNRVHIIGHVQHDDIWPYYYFASGYVQPSKSEALGLSVLEAMLCNVPVMAFPVGGLRDSIGDHNERGIHLDPNNLIETLEKAINAIERGDKEIITMTAKAADYVKEKIGTISKIQDVVSL